MKKFFVRPAFLVLCALVSLGASAQDAVKSKYDAHVLFNPLLNFQPGNEYRTGSGTPGPKYWQNRADYKINIALDETAGTLAGDVEITYKNNSPSDLEFLWLQLDQNAFSDSSRGGKTTPITGGRFGNTGFEGGNKITSVTVQQGKNKAQIAQFNVYDTRMQVRLNEPLKANGDVIKINLGFSFKIPKYGSDRMGTLETKNGTIYEIAQWYPRMCVI